MDKRQNHVRAEMPDIGPNVQGVSGLVHGAERRAREAMMEAVEWLYTIPESALYLNVKASTVRKWVLQKKLGYVKVGARAIRIPERYLHELIRRGWRAPIQDAALLQ